MRLVAEFLAGVLGGLVLGALGGFVGRTLGSMLDNGWGDLVAALSLASFGYVIGAAIATAFVRRRLAGSGSWWRALAGSFLGGRLVLLLAQPLRLNESPALLQASFVLLSPPGAMLAMRARGRAPGQAG
jgi:hypothetical protein